MLHALRVIYLCATIWDSVVDVHGKRARVVPFVTTPLRPTPHVSTSGTASLPTGRAYAGGIVTSSVVTLPSGRISKPGFKHDFKVDATTDEPASPVDGALPMSRRSVAAAAAASLLVARGSHAPAAAEEDKKNLGYVPKEYVAKNAGEKITTPNGLIYEALEIGSDGTGPRIGPPRSGSVVWVKFTGHTESPTGPIFDSSKLRGSRKANKPDYVEMRLNLEPTISNGMNEALKLMKIGGKGRFVQPPLLSYSEGKKPFEPDEEGEVKGKIEAGTTLYYDVELVSIVKP